MGRRENAIDWTVPARAELASFLRARKKAVNLTHEQIADRANGTPSKATLRRATSGVTVPLWGTVATFVEVTTTKEEEFIESVKAPLARALELWIRARRATRAPYYIHKAPDPTLIWDAADFSRALRAQHVWAGCPTPGEMERMAGPGELPSSTTRRIINGSTLPVDPQQALAFLKACYVTAPSDHDLWLAAALRAFLNTPSLSVKNFKTWTQAHDKLLTQLHVIHEGTSQSPSLLRIAA
ncbi:hypothetical protein ACFRQM_34980 [Streptomyces sp. NPDC056831]|uniref:hypothetical protein n=1 Tax=Streptomyces sp. NPDC056831 TaxID=3345954 RepID=UPI0036C12AD1